MSSARKLGRRSSGRIRAVLGLGMLLGVAQVGTMAAWTDSATVETGSFTAGTLDLTVGEHTAGQLEGQGGSWQHTDLALSAMAPGESVAAMLTVGNGGSTRLDYHGTIGTSGTLSGQDGLQVTVLMDATGATNTGTQAASDRTGSCEGGSATRLDESVVLAPGAARTYCVVAKLSESAPDAMQGGSGTVTLGFSAEQ